jgi:ribosomal subunit interface protein
MRPIQACKQGVKSGRLRALTPHGDDPTLFCSRGALLPRKPESERAMASNGSQLRVSGKNLDIGEALRDQARERVGATIGKYFTGGYSGHVLVEREGAGFRTDCVIHLDSGGIMRVSGASANAYASLDQAIERMTKQLRRDKRRRDDRPAGQADSTAAVPPAAEDDEPETALDAASRPIIAERIGLLPKIAIETAIAKMEAEERDNLVFRNAGTGRVNVIHKRPDGAIGWIDLDPADPR